MYGFQRELCSCLFTRSVLYVCKHIKVSVSLQCVFCVYPWKLLQREGEDRGEIRLYVGLEGGARGLSHSVSSRYLFQPRCLDVLDQTKHCGPNKTAEDKHW